MLARLSLVALCALVAAAPVMAKEKDRSGAKPEQVHCVGVYGPDSSEALVVETFGAENVVTGTVPGPEGTEMIATTVYPDTDHPIQFTWWDDDHTVIGSVELNATQTAPGGVRIGMSVDDVVALNEEPFAIGGFGWDYGGYANIESGNLAGLVEDVCYLSIRFSPTGDDFGMIDVTAVSGEVQVPTDEPLLQTLDVRVQTLSIGYPDPSYVDETAQ